MQWPSTRGAHLDRHAAMAAVGRAEVLQLARRNVDDRQLASSLLGIRVGGQQPAQAGLITLAARVRMLGTWGCL